jgi:hypothetical protein
MRVQFVPLLMLRIARAGQWWPEARNVALKMEVR